MDYRIDHAVEGGDQTVVVSRVSRDRISLAAYPVIKAAIGEDGAVDIHPYGTGALLSSDEWEAFVDAVSRARRGGGRT